VHLARREQQADAVARLRPPRTAAGHPCRGRRPARGVQALPRHRRPRTDPRVRGPRVPRPHRARLLREVPAADLLRRPVPGASDRARGLTARFTALALIALAANAYATTSAGAASCKPAPRASLVGCNFRNRDLHGIDVHAADLTGADFSGANLTGARITQATVTKANFAGAKLRLLVSGRLRGTPKALPKPWVLRHGFFLGPGVNAAGGAL